MPSRPPPLGVVQRCYMAAFDRYLTTIQDHDLDGEGEARRSMDRALGPLRVPRRPVQRRRSRIARLNDGEWLRRRYLDEDRSMTNIALLLECSHSTVAQALRSHRIPVRPPGRIARSALPSAT